jgi:hypothetical protein
MYKIAVYGTPVSLSYRKSSVHYITIIYFLDIIHRPVFVLIYHGHKLLDLLP